MTSLNISTNIEKTIKKKAVANKKRLALQILVFTLFLILSCIIIKN